MCNPFPKPCVRLQGKYTVFFLSLSMFVLKIWCIDNFRHCGEVVIKPYAEICVIEKRNATNTHYIIYKQSK